MKIDLFFVGVEHYLHRVLCKKIDDSENGTVRQNYENSRTLGPAYSLTKAVISCFTRAFIYEDVAYEVTVM